jgi:hypothetical protein
MNLEIPFIFYILKNSGAWFNELNTWNNFIIISRNMFWASYLSVWKGYFWKVPHCNNPKNPVPKKGIKITTIFEH